MSQIVPHPLDADDEPRCGQALFCKRPFFWESHSNMAVIADCSKVPEANIEFIRCKLKEQGLTDDDLENVLKLEFNYQTHCCDFGCNVPCPRECEECPVTEPSESSVPNPAILSLQVNGQWSEWDEEWTQCSHTCGEEGTQVPKIYVHD